MTPIFLDANVPMYSAGGAHELKDPCVQILALVSAKPDSFVTSVEVFQEIIYRYTSIRAWKRGRDVFREFWNLMQGRINAVLPADVEHAASLADHHAYVSARDLLHTAVMRRLGLHRIASADRRFDRLPGIERLDPMLIAEWAETVAG